MPTAVDILTLALRNAGIVGVGQTPLAEDVNDGFRLLNAMIEQWRIERQQMVIPGDIAIFPDLTTDVTFWAGKENLLYLTLAVRLRSAYGLPPDELQVKLAVNVLTTFQSNARRWQPSANPGPTSTVAHVLFLALRMAGRVDDQQGVDPASQDVDDAFQLLNAMIAQWRRHQFLAWVLTEQVIPSTGAISYAMTDRPASLNSAFARMLIGQPPAGINNAGPLDFPLAIIGSQEEYTEISLKRLSTFPAAVWYQPDYPTGSLWFWPIPPAGQFELHVFYPLPLPDYATPSDPLALPAEYTSALISNLAVQIIELNGKQPPPSLLMRARGQLDVVRCSNARVRELRMPAGLVPGTAGSGGISGAVGPHQSVIVLDSGLPVLG